jgi:hypothetical protein
MADFTRNSAADMAAGRADVNMGTTGSMHEINWGTEDAYWRDNFGARPYVKADRGYDYYRPAYEYGTQAASRYRGRQWTDVEPELERGWNQARGESKSAWQDVKDAVRDAWDRLTGHSPDRPGERR